MQREQTKPSQKKRKLKPMSLYLKSMARPTVHQVAWVRVNLPSVAGQDAQAGAQWSATCEATTTKQHRVKTKGF